MNEKECMESIYKAWLLLQQDIISNQQLSCGK